jgi:DNA-binding YbaB/EbfC family protein
MDFLKVFQQAQQIQERMKALQDELARMSVTGTAGGGMVTVEADGSGAVRRVRLDPSVVSADDREMLEDLLVVAVNDAQAKAKALAAEEMAKITSGLNLPFGMKLPF